jgi:hypothetical protein
VVSEPAPGAGIAELSEPLIGKVLVKWLLTPNLPIGNLEHHQINSVARVQYKNLNQTKQNKL